MTVVSTKGGGPGPTNCSQAKKKAPLGGAKRGIAQTFSFYLLPQVVGETNGMRGREPLINHRVETFITKDRA